MVLTLTWLALANDFTWNCDPILTPADAFKRSKVEKLGAIRAGKDAWEYARSFLPESCITRCGNNCREADCTLPDGTHITYEEQLGGDGADCGDTKQSILIERHSGGWTRLSVVTLAGACGGGEYGGELWTVAYDGVLTLDWPSSSEFTADKDWSLDESIKESWKDPSCTWSTAVVADSSPKTWIVSVNDTVVTVRDDGLCDEVNATMDDGDPVAVDPRTWEPMDDPCHRHEDCGGGCNGGSASVGLLGILLGRRQKRAIAQKGYCRSIR